MAKEKIEKAYQKAQSMSWSNVAKRFKYKIEKLSK